MENLLDSILKIFKPIDYDFINYRPPTFLDEIISQVHTYRQGLNDFEVATLIWENIIDSGDPSALDHTSQSMVRTWLEWYFQYSEFSIDSFLDNISTLSDDEKVQFKLLHR